MLHSEICALCIERTFLSAITVAYVHHFIAKSRDYVVSPEFMTTSTLSFKIDLTSTSSEVVLFERHPTGLTVARTESVKRLPHHLYY
jgi:hypothetical protein